MVLILPGYGGGRLGLGVGVVDAGQFRQPKTLVLFNHVNVLLINWQSASWALEPDTEVTPFAGRRRS